MLVVSRQRADQIVRSKGFPDPVADLACGRIWSTDAVKQWVDAGTRSVRHREMPVPVVASPIVQRCWACGSVLELIERADGSKSMACPEQGYDWMGGAARR
jgi:hypothetical protein